MTYILVNKNTHKTVAYFSVANDRVSIQDFPTNTDFNRFLKICRLGIDRSVQGKEIGTFLLDFIGTLFITDNKSGCRFITVDAYAQAIPFYLKNDFAFLSTEDEGQRTRLMYFDLSDLDN